MLPSLQLLEKVSQEVMSIPNKRKESKRRVHYGLFLLGYKSGLRVNEAVKFDLNARTSKGLYRIEKPKGKSERLVYVSKKVIGELKANNWQPNQTNRFNFYHFLRKIKKELGISKNTELTPHTLRRAFATYHAESGMPLPLLQKLLGHSSIRTTALYWQNIYGEDDPSDILTGKNWLENRKSPEPPAETLIKVNLEKTPQLLGDNLPLFNPPPNYLSKISQLEKQLTQIQSGTKLLEAQNTRLNSENSTLWQEKSQFQQDLSEAKQVINQLKQNLTNEQAKRVNAENNLFTEKRINQSLKETITNLTQQNHSIEQNHTSLINAYQKALNDKARAERQVNYYQDQLRTLAKAFSQWQKIKYYQQLEQERNQTEAKIEQTPTPWKPNK